MMIGWAASLQTALGIDPLGLPIVLDVTVDAIFAVFAFLLLAPFFLLFAFFATVAHGCSGQDQARWGARQN